MQIYLIRHTTPLVAANTCYGQADVDLSADYLQEAAEVKKKINEAVTKIWCSPLMRCRKLAEFLFPEQLIFFDDDLKEINCGRWELKSWDDIPKQELQHWMENYQTVPYPGGESYTMLQQRVMQVLQRISAEGHGTVGIVTHAGVIKCILALALGLTIEEVLRNYKLPYGAVHTLYLPHAIVHPPLLSSSRASVYNPAHSRANPHSCVANAGNNRASRE
jgi:alpha-ribazole phosphatase